MVSKISFSKSLSETNPNLKLCRTISGYFLCMILLVMWLTNSFLPSTDLFLKMQRFWDIEKILVRYISNLFLIIYVIFSRTRLFVTKNGWNFFQKVLSSETWTFYCLFGVFGLFGLFGVFGLFGLFGLFGVNYWNIVSHSFVNMFKQRFRWCFNLNQLPWLLSLLNLLFSFDLLQFFCHKRVIIFLNYFSEERASLIHLKRPCQIQCWIDLAEFLVHLSRCC